MKIYFTAFKNEFEKIKWIWSLKPLTLKFIILQNMIYKKIRRSILLCSLLLCYELKSYFVLCEEQALNTQ